MILRTVRVTLAVSLAGSLAFYWLTGRGLDLLQL